MTDLRTAAQQALEAYSRRDYDFGKYMEALRAALAEPVLQTCNCRWDGEMQMQQCTLHEAHVDAIKEWAQRAKFAEKKLAELAEQRLTDVQQEMERSIESLKAALAEPTTEESSAVEPVAWKLWDEDPQGGGDWRYYDAKDFKNGINPIEYFDGLVPLYTAPPQRPVEPVQEPVAWMHTDAYNPKNRHLEWSENRRGYLGDWIKTPLYAAPLQRAAEPVQEPVAWSYELATTMLEHGYDGWEHRITRYKPNVPEGSIRNLTPLFAAPPPLTEEEIQAAWDSVDMRHPRGNQTRIAFARAVERAHGITP